MPDPIFADSRLAAIYDDVDGDRNDLDHYEAIVDQLGARRVLDLGCGTGALAHRLAARGIEVIGVDPAQASLDVARAKPGGDRITWLLGDATTLPSDAIDAFGAVDVVTMTGNVAQVFLGDDEWDAVVAGARRALRPGGHLVFEARDPSFRGWEEWTRERSIETTDTVAGRVEHWAELTDVTLPLVSFRHTFRFLDVGDAVTSTSTLRFRTRDEITASLEAEGFTVVDVRDAPDRPGREFVFVARATSDAPSSATEPSAMTSAITALRRHFDSSDASVSIDPGANRPWSMHEETIRSALPRHADFPREVLEPQIEANPKATGSS